jgi:xanthine dehydrogenase YagT iron-sulfur-binding subunit
MEKSEMKKGKTFTRRDFLKGFGSGALGAAIAPKLLAQKAESIQTKEGSVPVYGQKQIALTVNGQKITWVVEPQETLLDLLREKFNLPGTKKICDRGECGGCTVLLNRKPIYACMYLAIRADGAEITTVESLAEQDKLHPVQQAFIDEDGYQCGFCTPGFIMSSVAFLEKTKNPTLEQIKMALSGNLCRCGNYSKIYKAVGEAAQQMRRP